MTEITDTVRELIITYGLSVVGSLAIVLIGRWLARLLVAGLRRVLERASVDATLVSFFANVAYYLLLALVVVAALANLGVPTTSVIAVLGAATLAIGLALQDSLGNLAAGVVIILLRPYRAGDYIEASDATGFVEEIQLFHTVLTTRDKKTAFVPNSDVMSGTIVNYSKTDLIRLDLVYGIGYDDDLLRAKQILQEIVAEHDLVAKDPVPTVAVNELGESSVNFTVRPYVHVEDEPQVQFDINEAVKLRFDQQGISIPFPQRDVHLYRAGNGQQARG